MVSSPAVVEAVDLRPVDLRPEDLKAAQAEYLRRQTIKSFAKFFYAFRPVPDYVFGRHTLEVIEALQQATEAVERGEKAYIILCMPPRHGKSDVASRRFPLWYLIRNPDHELVLASYNYQIATDMSFDVLKLLVRAGPFYNTYVERDRGAIHAWRIRGHRGGMFTTGIGGTVTGRGANVLVIDDYLKNRIDAESLVARQNVWDSFQSDLMTRLAPAHLVVIVANRWHEDDLVGRIQNKNNPAHAEYDPAFPKFKVMNYPAQNEKGEWLFPQRFDSEWYRVAKATMGTYAWQAQGLQDPKPRYGNLFRVDLVKKIGEADIPKGLSWSRGWDLASTEKQRVKEDPDFTAGTLAAFDRAHNVLYVKAVRTIQGAAPRRDKMMLDVAAQDGPGITVRLECVAGYKDTYEHFRAILRGTTVVRPVYPHRDKVARASILEPLFEAGNVHIVRGPWNESWLSEFGAFPSGKHDDQVDSLVVAVGGEILNRGRLTMSRL